MGRAVAGDGALVFVVGLHLQQHRDALLEIVVDLVAGAELLARAVEKLTTIFGWR